MNVIKKLIVNRHSVGETIKLMTKSRKCTNTNKSLILFFQINRY